MQKVYGSGDASILRSTLQEFGFVEDWGHIIYSDTRKDSRRVKLWRGNKLFEAPQLVQHALDNVLRARYGKRYVGAFFIIFSGRGNQDPQYKSFCVRLKK